MFEEDEDFDFGDDDDYGDLEDDFNELSEFLTE